jgi:hypothetical protein
MRAAAIGACIDVISCPMPTQVSLFGGSSKPSVVCLSRRAKERVEWQADFYASCLLMPKEMVVAAWRERFGNANPRILRRKNRIAPPGDASDELTGAIHSYEQQRDNEALQEFVPLRGTVQGLGRCHAHPTGETRPASSRGSAPRGPWLSAST